MEATHLPIAPRTVRASDRRPGILTPLKPVAVLAHVALLTALSPPERPACQAWVAPGTASDRAPRPGDPELALRTDVSTKVRATWREIGLDERTGVLTMGVVLTNSSPDTIRGPLALRVRRIGSEVADPTLLDVAPLGGAGVIHLDDALRGGILPPKGSTMPKKIRVHLARLHPIRHDPAERSGLVHIDAAVLAGGIRERDE